MNQPDLPTSCIRRQATARRGKSSASVVAFPKNAVLLLAALSTKIAKSEINSEKSTNHQNSARDAVPLKSVYLAKQVLTDSIIVTPGRLLLRINLSLSAVHQRP